MSQPFINFCFPTLTHTRLGNTYITWHKQKLQLHKSYKETPSKDFIHQVMQSTGLHCYNTTKLKTEFEFSLIRRI